MRITSNEVQAVKFSVALRGYAADEVDAFLEIVVKTVADYEGIHDRLQSEVKRLREALDECRETRIAAGPAKAQTVVTVQADEAVARVRDMIDEAARTSEQMVENVLEAGEHLLDQFRAAMTSGESQDGPGRR
ncbi:MAG: DivIVA domain-containing protein [bacterium]|nr:DivIVA domain-containing protein [bacterium]